MVCGTLTANDIITEKFTTWGYRDGAKRKGDKIGMDYTHGTVG